MMAAAPAGVTSGWQQFIQVHRQVGIAGFFIDLAVADPEHADRYPLGI